MPSSISNARLQWSADGEPRSELFDDLYFSTDNGLAESRYVFIHQNRLPHRWQDHNQPNFVIAETGFGSGLNFLASCVEFSRFCQSNPQARLKRLHFISFEKYPLSRQDLARAHQRWPELAELTAQLQQQYPPAISGCHRLMFNEGQIILDLWFGDIKDTLPTLASTTAGIVDAWFLDGFAPGKNPDMWQPAMFKQMARVAKADSTLATFTAASDVRRGLAAAGYDIVRVKGFGKKRQMITGSFTEVNVTQRQITNPPWFDRPASSTAQDITIIGGGIASAAAAIALVKRGKNVTLLCKDAQAALAASGNRQGGLYPLLSANQDPLSQLYSTGFGFSQVLVKSLVALGHAIPHGLNGLLQLGYTNDLQQRHHNIVTKGGWPKELVERVSMEQASDLAGVPLTSPALYYPDAGWVNPQSYTRALLSEAERLSGASFHGTFTMEFDVTINKLIPAEQGWLLEDAHKQQRQADTVILANGHHMLDFEQCQGLPLYPTSGQVSHVPGTPVSKRLKTVLCYKGYMTPAHEDNHCIGASFVQERTDMELTRQEQQENLDKLRDCTDAPWAQDLNDDEIAGKVGVRLSARDHLPMVGAVPKLSETAECYGDLQKGKRPSTYPTAPYYTNLYMIGVLGSRGLCSAPLLGEILASQIGDEPQPLSQSLLNGLNPNRYWIKQLLKGNRID